MTVKSRKVVLITGAAGGIGSCMAWEFGAEGARLVLSDRDLAGLETLRAALVEKGFEAHVYQVDVADREQVEEMVRAVEDRVGPVDVLVNNAGVGHHGELKDTTTETWRRLLDVNFWGMLNHVQAVLPSMVERGSGHIVNVSSGQVFFRLPTWGAYAAVKALVGVWSEVLHFELRRHGVKVTTVYPFMVNTGFYRDVPELSSGSRLSMKLLPYYSQEPEQVGRIIVEAVRRGRRVELVSPVNGLGQYIRAFRPVGDLVSMVSHRILGAAS